MAKDRLAALRACQDQEDAFCSIELQDIAPPPTTIQEFYKEVEELISCIDRLEENVEHVKKTHSHILSTPKVEEEVKKDLENTMGTISLDAGKVQKKLKIMKQETEQQQDKSSAEHRIHTTQYQMITNKFVEVMNDYQLTQANYRDKCKANIQRQLEITGLKTTDDEIEEMIESGNPAIFTRGIMDVTQEDAKQRLAEIEARHSDIMKLEKNIMELRDLFVDLANLVELQGEMVNNIENHVAMSKSHVDKARAEVNQAIAYRSKARIKKIICFLILIIFIVAIVSAAIYV